VDWLRAPDYELSRLLIQRGVAVIYLVAFTATLNQFRALLGTGGLLPAPRFLGRVRFRDAPSIFHLHYSDRFVTAVAGAGMVLAAGAVVGLVDHGPLWVSVVVWLLMWALYLSVVNVGQIFYSFGWESLLLEAGVLVAFLGNADTAPPTLTIWLLRWLVFRLEFGAGLIKLRGDQCWRDFTCLYFHHETQPLPNPFSWFFHQLPKRRHRIEGIANHVAQLVVPFGMFAPQPVASVAGVIIVVTQLWLVASGNFSWLNVSAIVLALAAIDDSFLGVIIPLSSGTVADAPAWHNAAVIALAAVVGILSYWPIANMVSRRQRMNASFNHYHFVNTYGAFGSISRVRNEIVIEGTDEETLSPTTVWKEYEFKGKPGDPRRRPPQIAPYHLRLDWLMWFAALSPSYARAWFRPLLVHLLKNDAPTLKLLRKNPFMDHPPRMVRARLYRYRFTSRRERRDTGAWWVRTLVSDYVRPVTLKE
jgi:Lipase maturation factor